MINVCKSVVPFTKFGGSSVILQLLTHYQYSNFTDIAIFLRNFA